MASKKGLASLSTIDMLALAGDANACSDIGEAIMSSLRDRVWAKVQDHAWVKTSLTNGVTPTSFRPRTEGDKDTAVTPKIVWRCTMSNGSHIEFSQSILVGEDFQIGAATFMHIEDAAAKFDLPTC